MVECSGPKAGKQWRRDSAGGRCGSRPQQPATILQVRQGRDRGSVRSVKSVRSGRRFPPALRLLATLAPLLFLAMGGGGVRAEFAGRPNV